MDQIDKDYCFYDIYFNSDESESSFHIVNNMLKENNLF